MLPERFKREAPWKQEANLREEIVLTHIKRMSLALVLALTMVMALAGTALAFDPPDHDNESGLCGVDLFRAIGALPEDADPPGFAGGGGPWNSTSKGASVNPSGKGIDFINAENAICEPPPPAP